MSHYLLSMYQPDGPTPPAADLERIMSEVGEINEEIRGAGAMVFSNGLHPAADAKLLHGDGERMLQTDGPFVEAKEHLGGITIVDTPEQEQALEWGRRMSLATGLPIEVRRFQDR